MRLGARLVCVLAACHLAGALRVAPPVTTRRTLLSQLAAATSLASTPAFAQQAAPEAVVRPLCGKQGRWLASAAQPASWPRLPDDWQPGSQRHDLALRRASGEPAGRGLEPACFF